MGNRLVVAVHDDIERLPRWLLDQIREERWIFCIKRALDKPVAMDEEVAQELRRLKIELSRLRGKVTHPVVEAVERVAKSFGKGPG